MIVTLPRIRCKSQFEENLEVSVLYASYHMIDGGSAGLVMYDHLEQAAYKVIGLECDSKN